MSFFKFDDTEVKKAVPPVRYQMGLRPVKGDVGLEIECEGNKFPKDSPTEGWKYVHDGSLRGQDNAEYVLKTPVRFTEVPEYVNSLFKALDDYGTVLDFSNRTSVHVHLNVQDFHLDRLCAFTSLYFCLEEILTEWCGEHRVGNLFCLRAIDAPATVFQLKRFFQADGVWSISDRLHYAGLNIHALQKFGSIEIRTLRGVTDPDTVIKWVSILQRLYELSDTYTDPRQVVDGFSGNGPEAFLKNILGDLYDDVVSEVCEDKDCDFISEALYRGIRIAQDLCYCRDWSQFVRQEIAEDPFGRVRKVRYSLDDALNMLSSPPSTSLFSTIPTWANEPHEEEDEDEDEDYEPEYDEEDY